MSLGADVGRCDYHAWFLIIPAISCRNTLNDLLQFRLAENLETVLLCDLQKKTLNDEFVAS